MRRIFFALVIVIASQLSCKKDGGTNNGTEGINPKITLVKSCCSDPFVPGNYRMGVWYQNKIFAVYPGRLIQLTADLQIASDTLLLWPGGTFVSRNSEGSKLLLAVWGRGTQYGSLVEYETVTFVPRNIRDSTYNISSAIYLPNENRCIYYSYGNTSRQIVPGYYRLDLATLQDSLLLQHFSEIGPSEVVNGFDISPDGWKLLFPVNRRTEPPLMVEYTIASAARETLNVVFNRQLLWLRYHPAGNLILYSNYPVGAAGHTVGDDSEIGIIDRRTLQKRVLDVNTNPGWLSVNLFPNWSPDGRHIVYGSAEGPATEPPGALSFYSLYILKDVN